MAGVESLDDDYLLAPFKEPQRKDKKRQRSSEEESNPDPVEADLVEHDEEAEAQLADGNSKKRKKNEKQQKPQLQKDPEAKNRKEAKRASDRAAKAVTLKTEIFELAEAAEWNDPSMQLPEERSLENLLTLVTAMREVDQKQILIVTPSAERAIAIIPVLKSIGKIGKLFARHMKVEEQIKAHQTHQFPVSVGTANRMVKLIEADAISPTKLGFVILDGTSLDKKERSLFSIPELKTDLISLLKLVKDVNVIVF
ncbi:U3-containing 90S pre-ribosomal complex subunit-domain containing protein [Obelidium mucronatum]|nr:U3-containing 90S pre-ribosomal complex subunit-domain containing protein [Obelidium mucronatum]